ncbi:pyridoxal phosphate-dependent aminotransferase [Methanoregula sp.]|jgi:threonine-phosphate decarboxylase|uniref:pyridoxal phosphate-dependent aminotransferase n=1 Tax=Methanoregula sp. TaxID=2052170 RepID=UPI003C1BE0E0
MAVDFPKPAIHGGTGKRQRENTGKNLLDFSASLNPLPPRFDWTCDPDLISAYPDNEYGRLKECIAGIFHRDTDEICVGNGSIELIRVFCAVALSAKKSCFIPSPTFGEYELSARLAGAVPVNNPKNATVSFACNPNNPTGKLNSRAEMMTCLQDVPSAGGILFVDEAFIELGDPLQTLVNERTESLFVLRSLTKSFAVPGIRFGYGFGDPELIAKIETARPPWSVNAYAESFALAAFRHLDQLENSRSYIRKERDFLHKNIEENGFVCYPSSANYLLVECACNVEPLCTKLETHDILVRDCTSFGLASCIRVAVRTHDENIRFLEALSACVH